MKLPRRSFLHLAAGAAVLPAVSSIATAEPIRRGRYASSGRFRRAACSIFKVRVCSPGARARSSGRYRLTAVLVQVAT
jgi:hypothetical protein